MYSNFVDMLVEYLGFMHTRQWWILKSHIILTVPIKSIWTNFKHDNNRMKQYVQILHKINTGIVTSIILLIN